MAHSTPPVDTAFQVQDNHDTWHAALIGPGILCRTRVRVSDHVELALEGDTQRDTRRWTYGTDLVDCRDCTRRIAALRAAA